MRFPLIYFKAAANEFPTFLLNVFLPYRLKKEMMRGCLR